MSTPSSNPTTKTVFVVGAGASQEAGLPIGSELKMSIATALDIRVKRGGYQLISGHDLILEALRLEAAKNPTHTDLLASLQNAAWRIRDAMPQASSIDTFIDNHSEDKQIELCGKLAIVRTILEAEAKSALFVDQLQGDHRMKFGRLQKRKQGHSTFLIDLDGCVCGGLTEWCRGKEKVSVWVQGSSATPVSWSLQERRSCTWNDIDT